MPHSRRDSPLDILLVEDDPSDALIVESMLKEVRKDDQLSRATTLAEAERMLSECRMVDVVLLDLTLPDSLGVETVAAVHAASPDVPIVVLTGTDDDELGLACVEAGAQDYVAKAALRPELLDRVILYTLARVRDAALRRELERELLDARSREQRRIAHDLHDGLGQSLAGIALLVRALAAKLEARGVPEVELATKLSELVRETIAESRSLARMLDPVTDEEGGLLAALEDLVRGLSRLFDVPIDLKRSAVRAVDRERAVHLYRIAQEAITNAVKHGEPSRITVGLAEQDGRIVLTVEDDGNGLPDPIERRGLGLRIMEHRARTIGGALTLEPGPNGKGLRVRCTAPGDRTGFRPVVAR